eukprot:UN08476
MMDDQINDDKYADRYTEICPISNPWRNNQDQDPIHIRPSPVACWNGYLALGRKFRFSVAGIPHETIYVRHLPPSLTKSEKNKERMLFCITQCTKKVIKKCEFDLLIGNWFNRNKQMC